MATQVWSHHLGFVPWPALPETPGKPEWSLALDKTFLSGSYALPSLPDANGRIAGVTSSGHLVAYDGTGHQAWSTALPTLGGHADSDSSTLVTELQVPGLTLLAVNRAVTSGDHQVDMFDGVSGQYLWSRTGPSLDAPKVLDTHRLLFESDSEPEPTVDVVDTRTGKLLWHKDVFSCQMFPSHLLCDTHDGVALVDPNTGTTAWQLHYPVTVQGTVFSYTAIVDGLAYLTDGESTTLSAVDVATGKVRWRQNLKIAEVDTMAPLDAGHVVVSGLHGSSVEGWTKELDAVATADGADHTLYTSSSTATTDAPTGGINVIAVGNTRYLLVVDPDGTAHTLTTQGATVATAGNTECVSVGPTIVGDTMTCADMHALTLYTIPALTRRTSISSPSTTTQTFYVIGTHCILQHDETITGLTE